LTTADAAVHLAIATMTAETTDGMTAETDGMTTGMTDGMTAETDGMTAETTDGMTAETDGTDIK